MGADVGQQDVRGAHHLAHVPQHLLRLHRERGVVLLHGEVVEDGLAQRGAVVDVPQRQVIAVLVVELLVDLPQGVGDVGLDVDVDVVVLVDLAGPEVDVDDLLAAVLVPEMRRVLDQVVADRDDDVGLVERGVDVVAPLQADGEQAMRVAASDRALAHEGVDHPDAGLVRQALELLGGAFAHRAVARQDDRVLGAGDDLGRLADRLVIGRRSPRLDDLQGFALRPRARRGPRAAR